MRVVQAQRTGSSGGRAKAKDFDDVTQEVIALTITIYRCYLSTRNAFPDHAMELAFLREAWAQACRQLNISMELSPTIAKLVCPRHVPFILLTFFRHRSLAAAHSCAESSRPR